MMLRWGRERDVTPDKKTRRPHMRGTGGSPHIAPGTYTTNRRDYRPRTGRTHRAASAAGSAPRWAGSASAAPLSPKCCSSSEILGSQFPKRRSHPAGSCSRRRIECDTSGVLAPISQTPARSLLRSCDANVKLSWPRRLSFMFEAALCDPMPAARRVRISSGRHGSRMSSFPPRSRDDRHRHRRK